MKSKIKLKKLKTQYPELNSYQCDVSNENSVKKLTKKINFKVESVDINMSLVMEGIQFKIISKNLITAAYEKSSLNFGEIVNYFNKNNIKIVDISTDDGDLEDVFVQLTKH